MSNLIGLAGFKESGKDAVAALLKMVGYTRFAFADEVRREVVNSFVDGYEVPLMPDHIWQAWLTCANADLIGDDMIYTKPMPVWGRQVLQWWGSEYRREQDSQYWVDKINNTICGLDLPAVISDVRFLNEASWIKKATLDSKTIGLLWRVERPGCKSDGHVSETELLDIPVDYVIHNNGDMQHLATQVLKGLALAKTSTK